MDYQRATILVAVLLLGLFLGTSSGFASLSIIQDQLRSIQLKLIHERLKLIQEKVLEVKTVSDQPVVAPPIPEKEPNAKELSQTLQGQIRVLEDIVKNLKPKALEEETLRLEKRLAEINEELRSASGNRLQELQSELAAVLRDYELLQGDVRASVEAAIKSRQAAVLREHIQTVQQKLNLVQIQEKVAAGLPAPKPVPADRSTIAYLRESIEKVKLKLLQAQIKAIRENILKLKGN